MSRLVVFLLVLGACGGSEPESHIAFKLHPQMMCKATEPLLARLEASGIEGVCPLVVNPDRTVTGTCHNVPAKEPRAFRLVYLTRLDREYELAVATQTRDLTDFRQNTLLLEFRAEDLDIDRDDDGDGDTNLAEYCCGTHPGIFTETCM